MALKDIASALGISISTVSRVLNTENTSAASQELKRKIWEEAKKQGYMPNQAARQLRESAIPDAPEPKSLYCVFAVAPQESKDDPFYTKILESVEQEAFKHNYILQYTFSATALDVPGALTPILSATPSDYLVIIGRFKPALLKRLEVYFKKTIYIGLNLLDAPCDQIVCNSREIARTVVRYLHSLNHRNIGFIGSAEGRLRGYQETVTDLKLPTDSRYIIDDTVLSMEGGYQGMLRLLDSAPDVTAVFCANDMVSIGALKACRDRGVRVPEDISLIGVNDVENVQYTDPMLSSVRVPLEEMGKMAVVMLLDRVNGGHTSHVTVQFPYTIVKRGSCRAL
ncbi:MAG: LacI family transcriptional regulator [Lachnospiraceae bacterium]|jgi:DNA-binding LacI/PurR family transcriptional regulator|nr:LacI family transcriptional regulator [Lachnospiraceae bacterium]